MNSSEKVTFQLLKCNRPLFEIDVEPNETTVLYFNGPWINYLAATAKCRCLREKHEYFLTVKTMSAANSTVATFSITTSQMFSEKVDQ